MTFEDQRNEKKHSRKYYFFIAVLGIGYIIFLVWLYYFLTKFGSSLLLTILILVFAFLIFLGGLFGAQHISFFSRFKRKKNKYLNDKDKFLKEYEKYHPHLRRVDYVNLNLKYRKPIVRNCPNCGITLASFVKKCPNCGEKIIT
jgi:hypothetical protein